MSRNLTATAVRALDYATKHDFAGPDPYDALLSPVAKLLRHRIPRQFWVQLIKRSPRGIRKAAGIRPVQMSKGIALFAEGASLIRHTDISIELADILLATGSNTAWGYEFDVQTRWAYYKAGSPNVIATAFSVRAIDAVNRSQDVSPKVLDWLYSLLDPTGYLYYTPESTRLIHNGNILAAETIHRLGGDVEVIQRALDCTLEQQSKDGSWAYGVGPGLEWVDNFHTAYVLESLLYFERQGFEVTSALEKGFEYWRRFLFSSEGLPLYYSKQTKPSLDIHNIATAVGLLASVLKDSRFDTQYLESATDHLLSFQDGSGGFRSATVMPVHMRWNQGHAFLALAKIVRGMENE